MFSKFFKKNNSTPKNHSILVVDDNEVDRTMVHKLLEKEGYQVFSEKEGGSAVQTALAQKPNLIILDHNLPDISGIEVCHRLKEHKATQNIPVIFVTDYDTPSNMVEGFNLQVENFFRKPIDSKILIKEVAITIEDYSNPKN